MWTRALLRALATTTMVMAAAGLSAADPFDAPDRSKMGGDEPFYVVRASEADCVAEAGAGRCKEVP